MSERPFKVEQWSKDFGGVTKVILEAADPNDALAEFDRVVKHWPRGWYTVEGERRSCASIRAAKAVNHRTCISEGTGLDFRQFDAKRLAA
jgi:hypothetical protein